MSTFLKAYGSLGSYKNNLVIATATYISVTKKEINPRGYKEKNHDTPVAKPRKIILIISRVQVFNPDGTDLRLSGGRNINMSRMTITKTRKKELKKCDLLKIQDLLK